MNSVLVILGLIGIIAVGGCLTQAPPDSPAVILPTTVTTPDSPNLKGTWSGPMQGYDEGNGFSDYPFFAVRMNVTEQKGRIFSGNFVFIANGSATESGFAGTVGRDGKTLTIAEHDGGYCTGQILGENEIELIYLQDGSPYSVAIDSFRRS